jgi:hypothetical protein
MALAGRFSKREQALLDAEIADCRRPARFRRITSSTDRMER